MSVTVTLFAPLALLLPAADLGKPARGAAEYVIPSTGNQLVSSLDATTSTLDAGEQLLSQMMAESFQPPVQNQVRIEQRITIRITPLPSPVQPSMLAALPQRAPTSRFTERAMGRCLPVAGIAGVQATTDNRLILYMRDQRVISAALDRTCSARDFYSGFYIQRSTDGQICVQRDTLFSRSGANCKLSRIRQLVAVSN